MIRSAFALITGFLSITFLNSFVLLIVSVYSKSEVSLSGVSQLPSPLLGYIITGAGFLFGLIGGLLTCSMAGGKAKTEVLCLVLLLVAAGFFTYHFTARHEPLWFLIGAPLLKVAGVFMAYYIKSKEEHIIQNKKTHNASF